MNNLLVGLWKWSCPECGDLEFFLEPNGRGKGFGRTESKFFWKMESDGTVLVARKSPEDCDIYEIKDLNTLVLKFPRDAPQMCCLRMNPITSKLPPDKFLESLKSF